MHNIKLNAWIVGLAEKNNINNSQARKRASKHKRTEKLPSIHIANFSRMHKIMLCFYLLKNSLYFSSVGSGETFLYCVEQWFSRRLHSCHITLFSWDNLSVSSWIIIFQVLHFKNFPYRNSKGKNESKAKSEINNYWWRDAFEFRANAKRWGELGWKAKRRSKNKCCKIHRTILG